MLPRREWDRATELLKLFVMTGWLAKPARSQSCLLISEPGNGKTELLDRFNQNVYLQYASDLTTRGLYPLLKMAAAGACTHVVATEFQKFFLRKSSTAESTLGALCQAMEEGVGKVLVGDKQVDFRGAQLGLIGAITHDTAQKWRAPLREYGFWSRCASFEWGLSIEEIREVMRSITRGDRGDLSPILLKPAQKKVYVEFPLSLSEQLENFTFDHFKNHTILRVFNRFRALAMASALLEGRESVRAYDIEKVLSFHAYWVRMVTG